MDPPVCPPVVRANEPAEGGQARKRKREKKVVEGPTPEQAAAWTQCKQWLQRKRRFCNMGRVPGLEFCGVHVNEGQGRAGPTPRHQNPRRIPCPVDPSHTIFESSLKTHVKICNRARIQRELELQPFYRKDANTGIGTDGATEDLSDERLLEAIERLYQTWVGDIELRFTQPPECAGLLEEANKSGMAFGKKRHIQQQVGIQVCILTANRLQLSRPIVCFRRPS